MLALLNKIMTSFLQLILFSLFPLIWWLFTDKKVSFFQWIGLKKVVGDRSKIWGMGVVVFAILVGLGLLLIIFVTGTKNLANAQFAKATPVAMIAMLFYAFIQTALAEEILFRGFLGKRLISYFGFLVGNLAQAACFATIHVLGIVSSSGIFTIVGVFIFTSLVGYLMGYINEQLVGGSILPSWIIHGCSNVASTVFLMFYL